MGARVLGVVPSRRELEGAPDAHIELVVGSEQDPRGGDAATPAVRDEDVANLGQGAGIEATARERHRCALPAVALLRFRVRQIDEAVVVRVDGNVHQPGEEDPGEYLRHTRNVTIEKLAVANHAQRTFVALGH